MIGVIYTADKNQTIIEHEEEMLRKYSEIAKGYSSAFAHYNCILKVGISWGNKEDRSDDRLPFEKGYECYAYCNVERNGKLIRYEAPDGEEVYYEMSVGWLISSIHKSIFRLRFGLNEDTTLIIEEIENLLETLEDLQKNESSL